MFETALETIAPYYVSQNQASKVLLPVNTNIPLNYLVNIPLVDLYVNVCNFC